MSTPASRTHDGRGEAEDNSGDRIAELVTALASPNGLIRKRARESLVEMGTSAVPAVTDALSSPDWRVRWEAAKALGEVAHPAAMDALIAAMEDERPGVRWVAAEGVIALGHRAVVPLLRALLGKADSAYFRLAAHHVLRALEGRGMDPYIQPVLKALDSVEPSITVPPAAEDALDLARSNPPQED